MLEKDKPHVSHSVLFWEFKIFFIWLIPLSLFTIFTWCMLVWCFFKFCEFENDFEQTSHKYSSTCFFKCEFRYFFWRKTFSQYLQAKTSSSSFLLSFGDLIILQERTWHFNFDDVLKHFSQYSHSNVLSVVLCLWVCFCRKGLHVNDFLDCSQVKSLPQSSHKKAN